MPLIPKLPPGRASRKALAFATDICRLRSAGYGFEAIRLALRDAGVQVSQTTVKREAAKAMSAAQPLRTTPPAEPRAQAVVHPAAPAPSPFAGDARSGQEIAQAFMQGRLSNSLIVERLPHETRRD
jgi:hypothetical protein